MANATVHFGTEDAELYAALKTLADHLNRPVSWVIRETIREYFEQRNEERRDRKKAAPGIFGDVK